MSKVNETTENLKKLRFFFTATPELASYIETEAKKIGLEHSAFIRMKMHEIMRKGTS